jgi:photosystem II stability/assembly factor-like uncharacterized protein
MKRRSLLATGLLAIAAGAGLLSARPLSAAETTMAALATSTHFHGLAVDASDPSRLFLATHHGLYRLQLDGRAEPVSQTRDDFMGFTAHPTDATILFASGHPADGGNLGFIMSKDGGRTWRKVSDGVGGPVDFHQMDVSKADPRVIYGVYGSLQRSADSGQTWSRVGPAPNGIISLAASSLSADTLYAATENGLRRSKDGGRSWEPAHILNRLATMVYVTRSGQVFAFLAGTGLVRADEKDLQWRVVSTDFGARYVLHFAADPTDERKLYAVTYDPQTRAQALVASSDGGATWAALGAQRPKSG